MFYYPIMSKSISVLGWPAWFTEKKYFFMEWFCYYLIILFKWCKIPHKTLDKTLLFSRNQLYCLKIWRLWRVSTTLQVEVFCWNLVQVSYLPMSTKRRAGFFWFCLNLELFAKIKKTWFLHTRFLIFLLITQDLNKLKKISNILF